MGLFQRLHGSVDLVLHQIQFCASLHLLAGVSLLLFGHQFPLHGLVGLRDFALVVDDGSTQLTRISLSRAIRPGSDQQAATSLRRDPVGEILWHRRSYRGGCTRCVILATPKPRVSLPPRHSQCVTEWANGHLGTCAQSKATGFGGGGNMATAFRVK